MYNLFVGEYTITFGRYRGETFRWLLENAPGWVGWLVSTFVEDTLKGATSTAKQEENKKALTVIANLV